MKPGRRTSWARSISQGAPHLACAVVVVAALGARALVAQESRALSQPADSRPADILFDSKLHLGVVIERHEQLGPPYLYWSPAPSSFDITPRFFPIRIPAGANWHVRPCAEPVWETGGEPITCPDYNDKELSALVDEVIAKRIPGISLVGCAGVTDRGIADLARAPNLTYLDLGGFPKESGPDLTDVGLRAIGGLSQLRTLNLSGLWRDLLGGWRAGGRVEATPGITDDGLESVSHLHNLRRLDLRGSFRITGAGVARLAPLESLEALVLTYCARSNPEPGLLAHLPPFPRLRFLDVSSTEIDGNDLARLANLPALEVLRMEFCPRLSDEDLLRLAALPRLKHVVIGQPDFFWSKMRITPQGIAALDAHMPECKIEWERPKKPR